MSNVFRDICKRVTAISAFLDFVHRLIFCQKHALATGSVSFLRSSDEKCLLGSLGNSKPVTEDGFLTDGNFKKVFNSYP
jgi:hypothetical protein